jgi:hypothetical protein
MRNYQAFVENVDPWALEDPGKSPAGGFIIGSRDFVKLIKERFLSSEQANKRNRSLPRFNPELT